jgi:hypothetical protein
MALLGVSLAINSSQMFGQAKAPNAIRAVLHSCSGGHSVIFPILVGIDAYLDELVPKSRFFKSEALVPPLGRYEYLPPCLDRCTG